VDLIPSSPSIFLSLSHALNHLRLDRAVPKCLSVEILALIAHAVALVTNDGNSNFSVVREASLLAMLSRVHSNLETVCHLCKFVGRAHVRSLETGTKRVNIEEGVLAMLDFSHRLLIESLVTLVTGSRQIHVGLLLLNLNALKSTFQAKIVSLVLNYGTRVITYSASKN